MGLEDDFLKNDLDDEKTIEYIKTRTHFYPFFGFYLAVMIEVGTKVAMPAETAAGITTQ